MRRVKATPTSEKGQIENEVTATTPVEDPVPDTPLSPDRKSPVPDSPMSPDRMSPPSRDRKCTPKRKYEAPVEIPLEKQEEEEPASKRRKLQPPACSSLLQQGDACRTIPFITNFRIPKVKTEPTQPRTSPTHEDAPQMPRQTTTRKSPPVLGQPHSSQQTQQKGGPQKPRKAAGRKSPPLLSDPRPQEPQPICRSPPLLPSRPALG